MPGDKTYPWQRPDRPFPEPNLAFQPHYQNDGLPVPPFASLLVAVSGGSDSLTLLHLLHDWRQRCPFELKLHAATVDHGLRPAARAEAETVAAQCRAIDVPHTILTWKRDGEAPPSSSQARAARYQLLGTHAAVLGINCIVLGHTMDDQAETVFMRAQRGGGTRGLSAMTLWTHHRVAGHPLVLYRPLLGIRRHRLQKDLKRRGIAWIDDPSNSDESRERPRLRNRLQEEGAPRISDLARLAALCSRSRAWFSHQVAAFIDAHAGISPEGIVVLERRETAFPLPVITGGVGVLVKLVGGNAFRVPDAKLSPLAEAWLAGRFERRNVAMAMVTCTKAGLRIDPDTRSPHQNNRTNAMELTTDPFEHFLPSVDLPIRGAIHRLLARAHSS